jgi:hypothetical protein
MTADACSAGMSSQRAGSQRPQEVLFVDTTTGQLGVIRQRDGDGAFVFYSQQGTAGVAMEQPGRFAVVRPDDTTDDPHSCQEPPTANTSRQVGTDRPKKRGRRGAGRGHRRGRR